MICLLKRGCGMSTKKMAVAAFSILSIALVLSACQMNPITITGAKSAGGIDEKFMPVGVTDTFPAGTRQVFCWFQWKSAEVGTKIVARWHFVTDNIHILNYEFSIPRKEGSGSVTLAMPEGKILPAGLYKVDLSIGESVLKSLAFKVK